jgi:hypothetical protein
MSYYQAKNLARQLELDALADGVVEIYRVEEFDLDDWVVTDICGRLVAGSDIVVSLAR